MTTVIKKKVAKNRNIMFILLNIISITGSKTPPIMIVKAIYNIDNITTDSKTILCLMLISSR